MRYLKKKLSVLYVILGVVIIGFLATLKAKGDLGVDIDIGNAIGFMLFSLVLTGIELGALSTCGLREKKGEK